jgi:hypothetical protein
MPPQIVRIALLTLGVVGSYAVARMFLVPPSFGEYGAYRGAALGEIAKRQPVYAGKKACDECHGEVFAVLTKGPHRPIACESCHTPTLAHAGDPDVKPVKLAKDFCLRCHEAGVARPAWLKQITLKDHYTSDRCTDCHLPHNPPEAPQ